MNLTEWINKPSMQETMPLDKLLTEPLEGDILAYSMLKIWKEGASNDLDKLMQIVEMLGLPIHGPPIMTAEHHKQFIQGMNVFVSGMAFLLMKIREHQENQTHENNQTHNQQRTELAGD
jgi:hypothetical protein